MGPLGMRVGFPAIFVIFVCVGAVLADVSEDGGLFQFKHSFKAPFYFSRSSNIPYWEFGGSTIVTDDYVRLTPLTQSSKGWLWNKLPTRFKYWRATIEFKIGGGGKFFGADGFGIWYTKETQGEGDVLGNADQFHGLGILIDTFDNDDKGDNPIVLAWVNDGTERYDQDNDGERNALAACKVALRNLKHKSSLRITYFKETLTVEVATESDGNWDECFSVNRVDLPIGNSFGFSAMTGGLMDNHDVYSMQVFSLPGPTVESENLAESISKSDSKSVEPDPVDADAEKDEELDELKKAREALQQERERLQAAEEERSRKREEEAERFAKEREERRREEAEADRRERERERELENQDDGGNPKVSISSVTKQISRVESKLLSRISAEIGDLRSSVDVLARPEDIERIVKTKSPSVSGVGREASLDVLLSTKSLAQDIADELKEVRSSFTEMEKTILALRSDFHSVRQSVNSMSTGTSRNDLNDKVANQLGQMSEKVSRMFSSQTRMSADLERSIRRSVGAPPIFLYVVIVFETFLIIGWVALDRFRRSRPKGFKLG